MEKFTENVATTLEHPLAVWYLMGNLAEIVDILEIFYQYNF